jgi:hypothetical protein
MSSRGRGCYRGPVDIRQCPNCHRTGRLLRSIPEASSEQYVCDLCGEVWVLEKNDAEKPPRPLTPPDQSESD